MKRTKTMTYNQTIESQELFLYATNDGDIYRQQITPAINNLRKKAIKGTYNQNKSIDLFYYITTAASDKYKKDFGFSFSVGDRFTAAADMVDYYKDEIFYNL